jgi:hypothetical protein
MVGCMYVHVVIWNVSRLSQIRTLSSSRYTNAKIVANYGNLFKHYDTLSPNHLHCVLRMFVRYAFDMGYPGLLCQASIFKTFQKLLKVAHIRDDLKVCMYILENVDRDLYWKSSNY